MCWLLQLTEPEWEVMLHQLPSCTLLLLLLLLMV
jgi:hypothetical protein